MSNIQLKYSRSLRMETWSPEKLQFHIDRVSSRLRVLRSSRFSGSLELTLCNLLDDLEFFKENSSVSAVRNTSPLACCLFRQLKR